MKFIKPLIIGLIIGIVGVLLFTAIYKDGKEGVGGTFKLPSYNSASSTAYTVGPDLSTKVMNQRGGRTFASLCNSSANVTWIAFTQTAIIATTSADIRLGTDSCFQMDRDIGYTGEVHILQETASTTGTLLVTEFIGF